MYITICTVFILYLVCNATRGVTNYVYLGCYFDEYPARRLIGDFKDFGKYLTQETCIDFCKSREYAYAGVQSSTQCFCGDHRPTSDDSRPESQCNYKCTGNQFQICGGDWRNSIFETGVRNNVTNGTNYGYLGCYFDQHPARRLIDEFKDFGKYLIPQICIGYCNGKGYPYAGVQSSTQCFCGHHRPTSDDSRPETECNSKCSGDQSLMCGGNWRNSIYETGVRGGTKHVYLGCYFDEPARRLIDEFKDFGKYLTPQTCIDYCNCKGHSYAGVQSSTQCFCGSHRPTSDDLRPEIECNYKCSGDQSLICGGDWRNSIYETGVKGKTHYVYLGCYFDQNPARRLIGDFKDFGKYLTQQTCIDYCKGKGYTYAGVQSSTQCFCGDNRPISDDSRPETECNYKCSGDKSQICGGDWRNSIYEIGDRDQSSYIYRGCYLDEYPARRLIDDHKDFGKYLTLKTCIDYCKGKGHPLAGVQSSTQCFCGDQRPTSIDLRPETECNYKCSGDQTQKCGGDWRNSIYETRVREDTNYVYLGCYFDEQSDRRLAGEFRDFGKHLTQQKCIDHCKDKGYPYAGVQSSTQCFCGDRKPTSKDSRPEGECNYKCSGDQSLKCGGDWRSSIYTTGVKEDTNYVYLGCYFDEQSDRRLAGEFRDFGKHLTQQKCIDHCKDKGYPYAGVQSSTQCFCGDRKPTSNDSRPEGECNYKCSGDQSLKCGGDWRSSIYTTGVKEDTNYVYLGCYFDEQSDRRLAGEFRDFGKHLTQQKCIDHCKDKGYPYAGVQSSTQCFCGDRKPTSKDSRPEGECNYKCSGDQSLKCGGDWRSSIYTTGVKEDTNYVYLGCYFDEQSDRRLAGEFRDFGKHLTQQKCIDHCKDKGYPYAGVQSSTQCFCGDRKPTSNDSRPEGECNYKCSGDQSLKCGGDWRSSIYTTGVKEDTNYVYLGCYFDEQSDRRLAGEFRDFGKHLTQQKCIDHCKDKGYPYAGVQSSTQCFCGDRKPTSKDSRPEGECNYKCSGDQSLKCGGDWRSSIYTTGVKEDTNYVYLGCYFDEQSDRRLAGEFRDFGKHLTQQKCIDHCKDKGYPYAGVQSSTQCFCGDRKPTSNDSRPEGECNYKCSGDQSLKCGGDWRSSIYTTGVKEDTNYVYLGCYFDEQSDRRLAGEFRDFGKHLTQQKCIDHCKDKGYPYAGVQSSTQCFCGDRKPTSNDSRPEGECNYKCSGDQSLKCGGDWRSSIYTTGVKEDTNYVYLGCYFDEQSDRRLAGEFRDFGKHLTQQKCIDHCKDKGYPYAGVQSSTQCFCGDRKPTSKDSRPEGECNYKCSGDQSLKCGGDWRSSIYTTGVKDGTISNYLGCYIDEHPKRRLVGDYKDFGEHLTQQKCIDYCKGKGYPYAGVQSSTQCFCSDQRPNSDDLRPETECNYKCSGNQSLICGSDWRNSIYETGIEGDAASIC